MAKFSALNPGEVYIGRGRDAALARAPYLAALGDGEAGRIELEKDENPVRAKRLLSMAAHESKIKIRSTYNTAENVILWKRIPAK